MQFMMMPTANNENETGRTYWYDRRKNVWIRDSEETLMNNFYAIMAYDHDVSLPINKQLKFWRYANQNINNPDQLLYLNNM